MTTLKRLAVVVLLSGCGGGAPAYLCEDASLANQTIQACEDAGAPSGYCSCVWTYLATRYECDASPPASAGAGACRECAPKHGLTCSL